MVTTYGRFNQELASGFGLNTEEILIGGNAFMNVTPFGTDDNQSSVLLYAGGTAITNTNVIATLSDIKENGVILSNLLNTSVDKMMHALILELSVAFEDDSIRGNEAFSEIVEKMHRYGSGKFTAKTMFNKSKMKQLLSEDDIFETAKSLRDTDVTKDNRTYEFIRYWADKLSLKSILGTSNVGTICLSNNARLLTATEIFTTVNRLGAKLDIADNIINAQRVQRSLQEWDLISIGEEERHLIHIGVIAPAGGGSEITIVKDVKIKKKLVEKNLVSSKIAEQIGIMVDVNDKGEITHEINVNLFINVVSTNAKLRSKLPSYMNDCLNTLDKILSIVVDTDDSVNSEELILLKTVLHRQLLVVPLAVAYGSYQSVTHDELSTAVEYMPVVDGVPNINALNFKMYLNVMRSIGHSHVPVGLNRNTFANNIASMGSTSIVTSTEVEASGDASSVLNVLYSLGGWYCDPSGAQVSKPMQCEVANGYIYGIDVPVKNIYDTTGVMRDRLNDWPVDFDGFYVNARTSPLMEPITKEEYKAVNNISKNLPFTVVGFNAMLKRNVVYSDTELIDIVRLASITKAIMPISAIIGLYMGKDVKPCFVTSEDRVILNVMVNEFNNSNSLSSYLDKDGMLTSIMLTSTISAWERSIYNKIYDDTASSTSITESYDGGFYYSGFKLHGREIVIKPLSALYTIDEKINEMVMGESGVELPTLRSVIASILDSNIDKVKSGFKRNILPEIHVESVKHKSVKSVTSMFENGFADDTYVPDAVGSFRGNNTKTKQPDDNRDWLFG